MGLPAARPTITPSTPVVSSNFGRSNNHFQQGIVLSSLLTYLKNIPVSLAFALSARVPTVRQHHGAFCTFSSTRHFQWRKDIIPTVRIFTVTGFERLLLPPFHRPYSGLRANVPASALMTLLTGHPIFISITLSIFSNIFMHLQKFLCYLP